MIWAPRGNPSQQHTLLHPLLDLDAGCICILQLLPQSLLLCLSNRKLLLPLINLLLLLLPQLVRQLLLLLPLLLQLQLKLTHAGLQLLPLKQQVVNLASKVTDFARLQLLPLKLQVANLASKVADFASKVVDLAGEVADLAAKVAVFVGKVADLAGKALQLLLLLPIVANKAACQLIGDVRQCVRWCLHPRKKHSRHMCVFLCMDNFSVYQLQV
jgi:hypothetical protein